MQNHRIRKKTSRIALGLTFPLFFAILFFDFADQAMLSPLLNPLLQDFFNNINNVVPLGWVTFTFTALSAVSMIIAGIYADRTSRKKICLVGALVYSGFSILTILTPHGQAGYVFFFITRALNGIGIGAIVPTIFSMVGDTVTPKRRTTAFAYVSVAMIAGRMAGFVIAGACTDRWRIAYFMLGIINLILALGLLAIKEPKRGAQEDELRDLILKGAEYRFRISTNDIKTIRANKSNFWLIMNFIDVFPGAIILFLIFKYMKDIHNINANSVNLMILLVAIFAAVGAIVFGRLGDRGFQKNKRAKVLIALFCNAFPIVFMMVFLSVNVWVPDDANLITIIKSPGVIIMVTAIAAAMFINQGVGPNWYSSLTDINLPEHRATIISLASFMDMLGNALGPLIGSYFATIWGIKTAMWSVLAFWVMNIFLWLPVLFHIRKDLDNVHKILNHRAEKIKRFVSDGQGALL
ncbi:MAG: MFS transporter [Candidatus Aminicenantes bacterium]|nr:MFS transporter [Candidatus Aminicenantes bacterium]NIM83493.1 MFS transporter [Candidatus Aminicenantes bacterium]NIN22885.1 MFS transporter [Candidatus Aminicenantes bacterium]NIN46621.1 MFS transporter [Candidatus Aminicenantes bacterium]NIN89524.1 MFS transporter [Candidatus Aminicenantes bacterium]